MSEVLERIQTAFAVDQARGFQNVTTIADLPRSFDELTVEWMTEALCGKVPGAHVVLLMLSQPDNGSSNRRRIAVEYNRVEKDHGLHEKLFCKASNDLSNRMVPGMSGGAKGEVNFYNLFRPHTQMEVPISYFAEWDQVSCNSLIILGDISDSVKSFCDNKTPMSRKWDRDLIAYYLDELTAQGGPKVTLDEAWLCYRQQLWTGLSWWLVTLCPPEGIPDMQPRDTTVAFLKWIGAVMGDAASATAFD